MKSEMAQQRNESEQERADRNFVELLQGARVAVTGVQVLFAFLLTVPFSSGFSRLDQTDRWLYYAALVSAAVASICYIAPTAQHRVLFRQGRKETLVRRSNLYGILGALALAVSMTTSTMFVIDYLFQATLAWITAGALAALAMWTWFGQPAFTRNGQSSERSSGDGNSVSSSED
ncbi:DUF6328 family protein [Nonomuraea gerenzanensis]|uniref:Integral membrane protein n=1 Tax=Nonomuraea gerenzanensis TaxID=93944 RepID=A0A1M4E8L6_9ACTN|nr:DUF6328 family protein [Nonomuraea gerenzanensis]UBU17465.1 DUF6328 family protein [Nonomuraea gerenzanensis]SBO95221.1 Integral membrane protein [Nonomuraea gerenzanensis]